MSIIQETESLLNLLLGVETQTSAQSPGESEELKSHVSQRLQRELTSFFNLLLQRLACTTDRLDDFTQKHCKKTDDRRIILKDNFKE